MILITELAHKKITELMRSKSQDNLALRVAIQGRGPGGFVYHLQFVPEAQVNAGDILQDEGDFKVYVEAGSADRLDGSTLDFVEDIHQRGFKLDNPNPLWDDPLSLRVQEVMDQHINPSIAAHGGYVSLLDVRDSVAYIELGGGCVGCGMVDVTLKQGIEVMIMDAIPEISQVVDTTDHASSTNPYFQPSKGGQSPFS
jgi:Fe/S biogenesis protein NfuA